MPAMRAIRQKYTIKASRKRVWRALVDPKIITAWGAGPAKMSARKGVKFSLWGGDIYGKNLKVVKEKQLVQEWYAGEWNHPSIVTIQLKLDRLGTQVDLVHKGVPKGEYDKIKKGWEEYFFGPMKKYLEKV